MIYSEAAYFEGNACQHCADRDEHLRLARINRQADQAAARSRNNRRAHP